jgi:hypothetical protein
MAASCLKQLITDANNRYVASKTSSIKTLVEIVNYFTKQWQCQDKNAFVSVRCPFSTLYTFKCEQTLVLAMTEEPFLG